MEIEDYLVVGEIAVTGAIKLHGEFMDPVIEIHIDPEENADTIVDGVYEFDIDLLHSDLHIQVPVKYREATTVLDEPSFSMTLYTEDGEEFESDSELFVEEGPWLQWAVRDTYCRFDSRDGVLDCVIPIERITEGEEMAFRVEMKADLHQYQWIHGGKGDLLEVLHDDRTFDIKIRVNKIAPLRIRFGAYLTATTEEGGWKEDYWLKATLENLSEVPFTFVIDCKETLTDLVRFPADMHELGTINPVEVLPMSGQTTCFSGTSFKGICKLRSEDSLKKDWTWWGQQSLPPDAWVRGPVWKTFTYELRFAVTGIEGEYAFDDTLTYPTITLERTIAIPEEKINAIKAAHDYYEAGMAYQVVAWGLVAVGLGVAAVPAFIAAFTLFGLGNDRVRYASTECPIEFDPDYRKIVKPARRKIGIKLPMQTPPEIRAIIESYEEIRSSSEAIRMSFVRYFSAIKRSKEAIAEKHYKKAESMLKRIEEELFSLKRQISEFNYYEERTGPPVEVSTIKDAIHVVRKQGLTDEQRQQLIDLGFEESNLVSTESALEKIDLETLEIELSPAFAMLYDGVVELHLYSLEKFREIQRVREISKEDVPIELFRKGLLTLEEFYEVRGPKEKRSNYLLDEIEGIRTTEKQKLANTGVLTTDDLLSKCSTEQKLTRIARRTKIRRSHLEKWVSWARLMRLAGIGEEQAEALYEIGITNPLKLSKAKVQSMQSKLKKFKGRMKRIPTQKQLKKWVTGAKDRTSR
ncbi:MAG: DUF4332 domain-containing protein [Candidatus Thorarchaeota archaeon]